jgi:hypothetical protein
MKRGKKGEVGSSEDEFSGDEEDEDGSDTSDEE